MKKLVDFFKNNLLDEDTNRQYQRTSYSQCGEDLIVDFIFSQLNIGKPSYLDIGAHHPVYLSNTYYFYLKGCRGVNIEPDPFLIREFFKLRKEDKNLNVGVGFKKEEEVADFFVMTTKTLNTFSKEEAEKYSRTGTQKIAEVLQVPLVPIDKAIEENFASTYPNFVSVDVEGLDLQIIQSFDFQRIRPEIFCIETLTYSEDNSERKIDEIISFMLSKQYFVYADTYINTIFVDANSWEKR